MHIVALWFLLAVQFGSMFAEPNNYAGQHHRFALASSANIAFINLLDVLNISKACRSRTNAGLSNVIQF